MADDVLTASLAETLRAARLARDLSVNALAERSGVSRAMIAKVEHGDAQPTAVLLARLAGALGMTLSELVTRAEGQDHRLARAADQPIWVDPETGYRRRTVSPRPGGPVELVEVELPPGTTVSYPADASVFAHQQVWILQGRLHLGENGQENELDPGDCLALSPSTARTFANRGRRACRYLVALSNRPD